MADTKKTGKKRGRTSLSEADKAHMAERRTAAATEKKAALEALNTNPQFRNPKFWGTVPATFSSEIVSAIQKGGDKAKQAEIRELEKKLQSLKGE